MAKHILIDSYFGLVRTAIAQGGRLLDYYEESPDQGRSKGNIYQGTIKKVDAHIQAAFVRYGGGRDGFLPLRDIPFRSEDKGGKGKGGEAPIGQGDSLLVQVVKDEVGSKGAALTTKLSLSGRYLVYMPDREGEGGISSRITDEERAALKKTLSELQIPEGSSVILRTAALGKPAEELQADLDRLIEAYREIAEQAHDRKEPGLIYREAPPALRYLREYYTPDVEKIWVNREDVLEQCRQFFYLYEPKSAAKVFLSKDGPLMFQKLGLEAEVDRLTARKVTLPSGANFVIDQTEALVAIDVNSAKSRDRDGSGGRGERSGNGSGDGEEEGGDRKGGEGRRRGDSAALRREKELEDTVFAINMEAGLEIARQLRLRDLGGIIVVDFIDMEEDSHRRKLEEAMRRALSADKAKVKVYDISPLGLMQISRQRLRKAGAHFSKTPCGSCLGRGWQSSPAVAAFAALRKMEERLQGRRVTGALTLTAPPAVVNQLMNEFRAFVIALEERHGVGVRVLADAKAEESVLSVQGGEGDAVRPVQGALGAKAESEEAGAGEARPEGRRKEGQQEVGRDKGRKERGRGRRAPREAEPAPVEISLELAAPEALAEPPREAVGIVPDAATDTLPSPFAGERDQFAVGPGAVSDSNGEMFGVSVTGDAGLEAEGRESNQPQGAADDRKGRRSRRGRGRGKDGRDSAVHQGSTERPESERRRQDSAGERHGPSEERREHGQERREDRREQRKGRQFHGRGKAGGGEGRDPGRVPGGLRGQAAEGRNVETAGPPERVPDRDMEPKGQGQGEGRGKRRRRRGRQGRSDGERGDRGEPRPAQEQVVSGPAPERPRGKPIEY